VGRGASLAGLIVAALGAGAPSAAAPPEDAKALSAKELFPGRPRHGRYRLTVDGGTRRVRSRMRRVEDTDEAAVWLLAMGEHRKSWLHYGKKTIQVKRQHMPREGMTLRYKPAVPLLPKDCAPGESVQRAGRLRIETEDGEVHEGALTHRVQVLGWGETEAEEGTVRALRVRTVDRVDLGMVDLRIEAVTHYVPEQGRAHQRMKTERTTLAVFSDTSTERFRVEKWRVDPAEDGDADEAR
jgi:hypothetical protein